MAQDGDHTVGDTPVQDVNDVNIISTGRLPDEEAAADIEANPPHEQRPALDPHADNLDDSLYTPNNLASTAEVEAYREAAETGETTVAGRMTEAFAHKDDVGRTGAVESDESEQVDTEKGTTSEGVLPPRRPGRPARGG